MTRIEVFVDAAFAFAVTILVISFDAIPRTFPDMVIAMKTIPAFISAVAILVWIWHTHTMWCRRYGLDDGPTTWLSALLLVIVLIYIYPMRVMLEGLFSWLSDGYLPTTFEIRSYEELRLMFAFMGTAFAALCLTFMMMYRYALRHSKTLRLDNLERHKTSSVVQVWSGCLVLNVLLIILALTLPERLVPFSGFVLLLIAAWVPLVESRVPKDRPVQQGATND